MSTRNDGPRSYWHNFQAGTRMIWQRIFYSYSQNHIPLNRGPQNYRARKFGFLFLWIFMKFKLKVVHMIVKERYKKIWRVLRQGVNANLKNYL